MSSRILPIVIVLVAGIALASEARAQIHPGVHAARATDSFGGVFGVGGHVAVTLRALPVDLFFAGEYFFPDCTNCALWGGSADVHLTFPGTIVRPYGSAGLVMRTTDVSDTYVSTGGVGLGGGVNLAMGVLRGFGEARFEFLDGSANQVMLRLGVRL